MTEEKEGKGKAASDDVSEPEEQEETEDRSEPEGGAASGVEEATSEDEGADASEEVASPKSSPPEAEDGARVRPGMRLSKLATGALSAMTNAGAATDPRQKGALSILRRFMVPIGVFCFLALLFLLFREILLPFILALVIVYLMEPIISRFGYTPEDPRGVPRWLAVILVYLVFFGVVSATVVGFVPRFVSEIVRFGETVPEEVQHFRNVQLPGLNKQLKGFINSYAPLITPKDEGGGEGSGDGVKKEGPIQDVASAVLTASGKVRSSRKGATATSRAYFEASRLVGLSSEVEMEWVLAGEPGFQERTYKVGYSDRTRAELARVLPRSDGGVWAFSNEGEEPAFRMVPARGGGFDFYLSDVELEFEQTGPESWRVRRVDDSLLLGEDGDEEASADGEDGEGADKTPEQSLQSAFDLERGLDGLIEEMVKSSNERLTSLISFAQQLVVGVIQAFVKLILTLMVAAFITIDLHGVMGFFRSLIPSEHRGSYDDLLVDLDRGLGGVVRGQLMICLVNGVLTYIGLVILDIKFSLLLAVVAGVLSLIPIFGTILSSIPIVLFGLTDGLVTGGLALLWILGIHFVEANILNPKIIGTSAHIHPVIVIFALLAGESAFGLVGALLAVPTASILLTLFKFFVMRSEQGREAFEGMEQSH